MTAAYDMERVAVACERLAAACGAAMAYDLPDWMAHRFATIKAEADSLRREIKNHKEESK